MILLIIVIIIVLILLLLWYLNKEDFILCDDNYNCSFYGGSGLGHEILQRSIYGNLISRPTLGGTIYNPSRIERLRYLTRVNRPMYGNIVSILRQNNLGRNLGSGFGRTSTPIYGTQISRPTYR